MTRTVFSIAKYAGIGALALTVVACAPRVDMRGNLPDEEVLAEIIPGEMEKEEVADLLGAPSTSAMFDGESWYYISEVTETLAFFEPEVTDRKVIIIKFDEEGVVAKVEKLDMTHGEKVVPVERKTPTAGNEITFFEQMFGNIGKFNK
ncbi:MAG: outer membrane protein assembly factor BamE [Alphaproteobacteria bacterium]|nr:outer membrane protein assembly factor BamE [Rhodospirillales bacterium]MCW9045148.1 outer membrane protein assembly factor BamE [Alphaproteobacteria bacterium]